MNPEKERYCRQCKTYELISEFVFPNLYKCKKCIAKNRKIKNGKICPRCKRILIPNQFKKSNKTCLNCNAKCKKYNTENREKRKQWLENNPAKAKKYSERKKAYNKEWVKNNPDKVKAYRKIYIAKTPKMREYYRDYYKNRSEEECKTLHDDYIKRMISLKYRLHFSKISDSAVNQKREQLALYRNIKSIDQTVKDLT